MQSGNKPLPEAMLTQIYVTIIMASLGHNELTHCVIVMPYGDMGLGQH